MIRMTLIRTEKHKKVHAIHAATLAGALMALAFLVGCGKSQPASESSGAKSATIAIDPATAGSISGVVNFKGAPPKLKPLDMAQDPACPSGPQSAEGVRVSGGRLADVFLYVK